MQNSHVPLIEESIVPEVFVSGIGRIEKIAGGMVRIVFYVEKHNDAGEMEHVVAAKIIRPLATWPQALRLLSRALSDADMPLVADGGTIRALDS